MPSVSVIIPVYNVEQYLRRCIDSILAQIYTDFELILVDDGSTDKSGDLCEEYESLDSRIKVVRQRNSGVSVARNNGIAIAEGEFLAFIDGDDFVDSDYLLQHWNNRSDLTISSCIICREDGESLWGDKYEEIYYPTRKDINFVYLCDKMFSPCCRLFRRDIVIANRLNFPIGISWGEDALFGSQYASYINNACVLSYSGYHYVQHDDSNSLSSTIRLDIIDDITTTREANLFNLLRCTENGHDEMRAILEEDIRVLCAAYVNKVFKDQSMEHVDRIRVFKHFYTNRYVLETIEKRKQYYSENLIQISLLHRHPILVYELLKIKTTAFQKLYSILCRVYMGLPRSIRRGLKRMKGIWR